MLTMGYKGFHISEQDLLLAADGELSPRKMAGVRKHLEACWTCRARMAEIEAAIVDFVQVHRSLEMELPGSRGPRAMLQSRLAELAATPRPGVWQRLFDTAFASRGPAYAALALVFTLGAGMMLWSGASKNPGLGNDYLSAGAAPDPRLTPGMTQPLTKADLCAMGHQERAPSVPRAVALSVFRAYGIDDPRPRAYELDYLITPQLGGSNDIRNLWPQPYQADSWSAHAKDALEEHLYQLVCVGNLDLATAQADIAKDWIAAYKKYFRTEDPLPTHTAFLKDVPWE
jgi:hypothetical protein